MIKRQELLSEEFSPASPKAKALRTRINIQSQRDPHIYKLQGPDDRTLMFESRFESGNLYLA